MNPKKKRIEAEIVEQTVQMIVEEKTRQGVDYVTLCRGLKVTYPSFMRWKQRIRRGRMAIGKSGPRKIGILDQSKLMEDIQNLKHARKRTQGTVQLHEQYQESISRRNFRSVVTYARLVKNLKRDSHVRHISWKTPGLVWSMDDSEFGLDWKGEKQHLHSVRDQASRYYFPPIAGKQTEGERVAHNLEILFKCYGPPLIMKSDCGSNLNHSAVKKVLADYWVITLNNPPYYPKYNGGIENAQGELKKQIREDSLMNLPQYALNLAVTARDVAHELNHKRRRVNGGKTACELLCKNSVAGKYTKRKRKEVIEWLKVKSACIMAESETRHRRIDVTAAWRRAVEIWLQENGHIEVSVRPKVLPHFSFDFVS